MDASQHRFFAALTLILAAGAALIGYRILQWPTPIAVDATAISVACPDGDSLMGEEVGIVRGAPEAPVVIRVYTDYLCPYCGMVARLTIPQIVTGYVETGKVRLILYDFPVHGESSRFGAEAARCAGDQGAYWAMHDILFRRVGEWSGTGDPRDLFRRYGRSLGLEHGAFGECLESREYRCAVVASQNRGRRLGVSGAPTFIVNGHRLAGAVGFDRLAAMIEDQLAGG